MKSNRKKISFFSRSRKKLKIDVTKLMQACGHCGEKMPIISWPEHIKSCPKRNANPIAPFGSKRHRNIRTRLRILESMDLV
ncbi:MAG: hypothetical protein WCS89_00395 [Candidatus Paceibacterota bacterium]